MKTVVWIVAAVLALLWSASAFVLLQLAEWLANAVPTGTLSDAVALAAQWPMPPWLALWIDPAFVQMALSHFVEMARWVDVMVPEMSSLLSWMTPVIWIIWIAGMIMLLLAAAIGHWLAGKFHGNPGVKLPVAPEGPGRAW